MKKIKRGISTIVTHSNQNHETPNPHISPIYQTSAFRFDDAQSGAAAFSGEKADYIYTRMDNPNHRQVVEKISALECMDLESLAEGYLFSSGMAAINAAILAKVESGETIIVQKNIYGSTYSLLNLMQERFQIQVVWINDGNPEEWEKCFSEHPHARLAYAETPSNPNSALLIYKKSQKLRIKMMPGCWLTIHLPVLIVSDRLIWAQILSSIRQLNIFPVMA